MTTKSNWVSNPTKRQIILMTLIWLTGIILMILVMTNFFTESAFKSKNLILFFLIILATKTEIKVIRNFFKNQTIDK